MKEKTLIQLLQSSALDPALTLLDFTHTDGVELDKMRKGTGTAFCLTVARNFLSGEGGGTKG
jgi:hypothetical protein